MARSFRATALRCKRREGRLLSDTGIHQLLNDEDTDTQTENDDDESDTKRGDVETSHEKSYLSTDASMVAIN